jgi:hypothetical protein
MDKVFTDKRGLVIILVIATVLIFIGAVWAIATYLPLNLLGLPHPSSTATAPVAGKNCTHPVSYWKNHPELYPAQLIIGGQVYKTKDIQGIFSDDPQELTIQLQAQLTGAYLNFLSGADQSYVETTIFEAYGWLVQHPVGSALSDSERETGTRLYNVLETYNQGLTEVAPCEPGLALTVTESGTATENPNTLLTVTPTETVTPIPSETPTLIEFSATATYIFVLPTRTATQTTEPPIQIPSNTPVIPTEAPTATNPPPPPDTATFTPPPPPTPTLPPPTPTLPLPTSAFR